MESKKYNVHKSEAEWKEKLTPDQFRILRQAGTEMPGTSKFNDCLLYTSDAADE